MSLKVNNRLLKSNRRTCPYKVKLTMENAQDYLLAAQKDGKHGPDAEHLALYVCSACGFLHIGHPPEWRNKQS